MRIRKLKNYDIPYVVELWYETSVLAHDFIPPDYWKDKKDAMASKYLPDSETYLAVDGNDIYGFISIVGNYLAAIFIKKDLQRSGIGKKLLDYVKKTKSSIELKVYKKNLDSIKFYIKQDFMIVSESNDESTNEIEVLMRWNK